MHKKLRPHTAPKAMTRFGIGPPLAAFSILYCLVMYAATRHFAPLFSMNALPPMIRTILGTAFISAGIAFFITALKALTQAYNCGILKKDGVFAACRHPIYSAWIVFIVPGMAFLTNSWLGLTAPIAMYGLFKVLIKKEENYLQEKFGAEFARYKKNVPELLPAGWLKKNNE
ncbi:MAG: isoprenylcysteine carboxylmethyltransferase family protein [Pseudomonadota bacterium]